MLALRGRLCDNGCVRGAKGMRAPPCFGGGKIFCRGRAESVPCRGAAQDAAEAGAFCGRKAASRRAPPRARFAAGRGHALRSARKKEKRRMAACREVDSGMKDYQKTMLFLYPRLKRFAEDIGQYARAKAIASSLGREDTEATVQALIDCAHAQRCCGQLKALLDGVLGELTEEERLLLEYKYFRRRTKACGVPFGFSPRTYYRRQLRLERRMNAKFLQRGMDEGWFLRTFGGIPAVRQVLGHVRERRERALVDKRLRCGLECRARFSRAGMCAAKAEPPARAEKAEPSARAAQK